MRSLANVRGSAVNTAGRSSGLTAPSGPAQHSLIVAAIAAGHLSAADVAYLAVHGTGTPLGDPIEMGAVGSSLAAQRGSSGCLVLGSSKSCYGHTEGTAGLTGALLAAASLQQQACAPIANLRLVNPYVSAALADWRSRHGVPAALPRQQAALPAEAARGGQLAGTSSFGMSGVNAHLLLGPADGWEASLASAAASPLSWQRQLCWPAPTPHSLLQLAHSAAACGVATFTCSLEGATSAFLRDHRISGRLLLPATASLELILAASAASLQSGPRQRVGLAAVALQSAKLLQQHRVSGADAVVCGLQLLAGTAEVASPDGTTHVSCGFAPLSLPVLRQPAGSAPSAVSIALPANPVAVERSSCAMLGGSTPAGDGWLAYPAAADAALHLSAVPATSQDASSGRIPVSVATVQASPRRAGSPEQWTCSQLPLVSADKLATCSINASLAGGSSFNACSLRAKLLPGGGKASAASATAADSKAFEQQNFAYKLQWQAAAAAAHSFVPQQLVRLLSGSGLHVLSDEAGGQGLEAALEAAGQLTISPAGSTSTCTAATAGGIEMLQRLLSARHAVQSVRAVTLASSTAAGAAPRGQSAASAVLAALMKVAAVERPERVWSTLALDPLLPQHAHVFCAAAPDEHGCQQAGAVQHEPRLLRHHV